MGNVLGIETIFANDKKTPSTPTLKTLTDDQVKLIKRTWAIPYANPLDSGELILYTYFERFPENQQKFAAFRNSPLIVLKGSPLFRNHAHKIMNVFAAAIDALEDLESVNRIIVDMAKYHKRRGISKKNFSDLRFVVIEILTNICPLDQDGVQAWNDLFDTIYHITFIVLDENKRGYKKSP